MFITHDLRLASHICDEISCSMPAARWNAARPRRCWRPGASLHALPATCLPAMTGPRRTLFALADRMPGLVALGRNARLSLRAALPDRRRGLPHANHRTTPPDRHHRSLPACRPHVTHHHIRSSSGTAITAGTTAPACRCRRQAIPFVLEIERRTGRCAMQASSSASEFVGLVGESGSGKSTLARLIMGLEHASTGRIVLGDRDVTRASAADARHRLHWRRWCFRTRNRRSIRGAGSATS